MPSTVARANPAPSRKHYDFSHCDRLRVGVISDTHGHIDADVQNRLLGCELILHAGDIGSSSVLHQLRSICQDVIPVRGNNDCTGKWPSQEHAELATLSEIAEVKLPGGCVVLTHGDAFDPPANRHKKLRQHFTDSTAIIYGHSHKLVCDQEEAPWILNPGAAGKTHTRGGASCLLISAGNTQWDISEFRVRSPV